MMRILILFILNDFVASDIKLVLIDQRPEVTHICQTAIDEARGKGECSGDTININRVDGCVVERQAFGTINAAQLYYDNNVDAYISPTCGDELEEVARLGFFWKKPVLTRAPVDSDLLNVDNFPNVVQFSPSTYSGLGLTVAEIAERLEIKELALIGPTLTEDEYPVAYGLYEFFQMHTQTSLKVKTYISVDETDRDYDEKRGSIKKTTKLIILGSDFPELKRSMDRLDIASLTGSSFVVVLVCALPLQICLDEEVRGYVAWAGIVVVGPSMEDYEELDLELAQFAPNNTYSSKQLFSAYLSTYNACYGFCLKSRTNYNSGDTYQREFRNVTFTNRMGTSQFDGGGSLIRNYDVLYLEKANANYTAIMKISAVPKSCTGSSSCVLVSVRDEKLDFWTALRAHNVEPCVLDGTCKNYWLLVLASFGGVFFICSLGALWHYRRKRRLNLFRMHWRVPKESLKIIENKQSSVKGKSVGDGLSSKRRTIASYALYGTSKADFIVMKQTKKIRWTRPELKYLFELKQLTHDNITKFLGICFNDLDHFYILNALIERASLEDFVFDQEFNLDATFRSAFLRDILKGLQYLHKSPIGFHGLLNVQNCLIDANWVLKLSNFGVSSMVHEFVKSGTLEAIEVIPFPSYQAYAPEVLKDVDLGKNYPKGTQQADMYSMGMILYHVIFRAAPFEKYTLGPRELIEEIIKHNLQPEFSNYDDDPLLIIMEKCWDRNPESRPKIREISQTVSKSFSTAKGNLVDQMIKMNEKYAQNLEKIVAERNAMLQVAQEATDRLLCEMLPASIAQVLKNGGTVPPRSYDSVTVLFCQLVDFGNLCAASSPEQIINFLNEVFTQFDEIIKIHDAYKVETTGETYMVSSGVPNENGGRHVFEIADVSLEIREAAHKYTVAHLPHYKVAVRIGFHCGPIAAGVIGIRSPRYCLFGDTVNFASRMQSNCPKNQIQTSEVTALKLFDVPEYKLVQRGVVKVKGKGEVNCFWLNEHIHPEEHKVVVPRAKSRECRESTSSKASTAPLSSRSIVSAMSVFSDIFEEP